MDASHRLRHFTRSERSGTDVPKRLRPTHPIAEAACQNHIHDLPFLLEPGSPAMTPTDRSRYGPRRPLLQTAGRRSARPPLGAEPQGGHSPTSGSRASQTGRPASTISANQVDKPVSSRRDRDARLQSLPPFDTDLLILTDLRIMRVRTDAQGSIAQLSEAALGRSVPSAQKTSVDARP